MESREADGTPLQYSLWKSMRQKTQWGCLQQVSEIRRDELLHFNFTLCIGEGSSNPSSVLAWKNQDGESGDCCLWVIHRTTTSGDPAAPALTEYCGFGLTFGSFSPAWFCRIPQVIACVNSSTLPFYCSSVLWYGYTTVGLAHLY